MERKRQRDIAIGALALAIVAIVAFRLFTSVGNRSDAATRPTPGAGTQAPTPKEQVTQVDLQGLEGDRPEPVDSTRDPFRFKPRPPPPPPPPPRPAMPGGGTTGPPTGPVAPPPPPRIQLKFIGILGSAKTGLIASLVDGRGLPILGKEGEVIEGRYRIVRIGVESIDLAYLDGRGRQTIRLTGQ